MPASIASRRTAFLWSVDNLMGMETAKHTASWDSWQHYYIYYQKLKTMGVPVTFIQESDSFDIKQFPFLIAPAYEMIDEKLVAKLKRYVTSGGTLILSTRTGMKNKNGHLWETLLQEPIGSLIGANIDFYDQLPPGLNGSLKMDTSIYLWNVWGDILNAHPGTEVLATHADQFYKGKAAVVKNKIGNGQVYYIGVQSNDGGLENAILRRAYLLAGANVIDIPDYIFQEWRDGYYVVVNYSSSPYKVTIPGGHKIYSGKPVVQPGGVLVYALE